MLSLDGIPLLGTLGWPNTALDVSNSAFEGSLYGTSQQSLTLVI